MTDEINFNRPIEFMNGTPAMKGCYVPADDTYVIHRQNDRSLGIIVNKFGVHPAGGKQVVRQTLRYITIGEINIERTATSLELMADDGSLILIPRGDVPAFLAACKKLHELPDHPDD